MQHLRAIRPGEARVAGAGDELKAVDIVGAGEEALLRAIAGDFEPVHGEIEVAALEAAEEGVELVLFELDGPGQFTRQSCGDFDFDLAIRIFPGNRAALSGAAFPLQAALRQNGRKRLVSGAGAALQLGGRPL